MAEKQLSRFLQDFRYARSVGVPLIAVQTADPVQTMRNISEQVEEGVDKGKEPPILRFDVASGMTALNDTGGTVLKNICAPSRTDPSTIIDPIRAMKVAQELPGKSILFFLNGHRFIGSRGSSEAAVGQAIWNLRDKFKMNRRNLIILCPGISLPEELKQDVMVLDEPLPTPEELEKMAHMMLEAAKMDEKKLPSDLIVKAVEATRGLSMFGAEQAYATSLSKTNGYDLERLWERKRVQVEQTPGLSIYRGKETFQDVTGVETIKHFLTRLFNGKNPPTGIAFMDEIEKMFAGIQGDLSGTSQEQHGEFLRWMQDNEVLGTMWVGHGGCSKSYLAKACAGQFGIPMTALNMSALKGSLVGQTGFQTRMALKTISAICRPLVIATSNSMAILPPELRRRFQLGTWFFDLPSAEEREAAWMLYLEKYKLKDVYRPIDTNWTPYEIKTCCDIAWRLDCSLIEASNYLVPISMSSPDKIKKLREDANNRFNSASHPGPYKYDEKALASTQLSIKQLQGAGEA